ncbi:MAG: hypothetical protein NWE93_08140 [Candidatus Bathyarchaeota archaeon]|nr:hypothetical protein [Candidatus Bathyarchaeota archaeon]
MQNALAVVNPLPAAMESKYQRDAGIVIGFGIGLIALGFGAALISSINYSHFAEALSWQGIVIDNRLFRDLLDNIALFLSMGVGGILMAVMGAVSIKSQRFRNSMAEGMMRKNFVGNFLFGCGFGVIAISFRFLFLYLLAPTDLSLNYDYLQLKMFGGFFAVGLTMFTVGILSWRRKK